MTIDSAATATTSTGLVFSTAVELAEAIRQRQFSAVEILQAHLDHVARYNPPLNAIVTLNAEAAMARAAEADKALTRGELWGPLHGVPMTVKDHLKTAGMRTTAGLPVLAEYVPTEDATVVGRMREAGAIIVGKTNAPVGGFHTDNEVFGRTNNPWDLERGPGGSSGGSAAAVAAGLVPMDLGSDGGGSIRVPAHYCGVYTIKATERSVSLAGHASYDPIVAKLPAPSAVRFMGTAAPVARSVDDLILSLGIISGPDVSQWEVPPVPLGPIPTLRLDELRLAWTDDFGVPVTRDTSRVLSRLASELASAGARIERESVAGLDSDRACEAWGGLYPTGAGMVPDEESSAALDPDVEEPAHRGLARVMSNKLTEYLALAVIRDELIGALETFFAQWDALLCPVTVGPAFRHCPQGVPMAVDEKTVTYWRAGIAYTAPFNLTGHPAAVVPGGLSSEGLPIGVQVVGRRWDDAKVLGIARAVSGVLGPWRAPPGYATATNEPRP
jgi:amidase